MSSKKVLIISYYWPPTGGSGVQRWLKFSKYLPEFGWKPIIFTPENPEAPSLDPTLMQDVPPEAEVIRIPIWEPYSWYKRLLGKKSSVNTGFLKEEGEKSGWIESVSVWIRGNAFIPDARKFWIRPASRFLISYLKNHPVDAIVSTGPPHSMHLIALKVKQATGTPWIADFRDPWTNIDFYKDLKLSSYADKKHHRLEHEVLTKADAVVTVGYTLASEMQALCGRPINVITNGFDETDFSSGEEIDLTEESFILTHAGTLVPSRNPESLWRALEELVSENAKVAKHIRIQLVGSVDVSIKESINRYRLESFVDYIPVIPHKEIASVLKSSNALLLILNNTPNAKGILTGKFFEYMASGRPIIAIGPKDGDIARILQETKTGTIADFDDVEELKEQLLALFDSRRDQKPVASEISTYSRKSLTSDLVSLLEKVLQS